MRDKPFIPWAKKPGDLPQASVPAFPGAQGGGMYSFGGRGGRVFVVTNLNDSGPGSFREALEAGGPRFVVFNVAGIIRLKERILVRAPYLTIDGSHAPGDGICIAGDTVEIDTHDVIIRHMRFRRGATWVGDRNDSLGGNPVGNIIIDHVSASWGLDENLSMYRHMYEPADGSLAQKLPTVNITIQNSIFSEALDTYNHSFGSTLGGYNSTFHHNLWACNTGRNPSVGMIYDFSFANNVLYNWRHRTIDGGDHRSFYTIINNYFKPGPITDRSRPISYRILKPEKRRSPTFNLDFGKAYVAGNIVEGNEQVTKNNWDCGVQFEDSELLPINEQLTQKELRSGKADLTPEQRRTLAEQRRIEIMAQVKADKPYPHSYLMIQPAKEAYKFVLAEAGATLPKRDAVDQRVIEMVRTGKVGYQEGKGIITNIEQVGGYPKYQGEPLADSDGDGMPDQWELQYNLEPDDPSDASGDLNGDGYTHIEDYLYGLDPGTLYVPWSAPRNYQDLFWQ
ncbi:hypothetical protein [Bythopirellula polymerisocia]|nr:hypothetical protein [Bythopirellula polymerisocia]